MNSNSANKPMQTMIENSVTIHTATRLSGMTIDTGRIAAPSAVAGRMPASNDPCHRQLGQSVVNDAPEHIHNDLDDEIGNHRFASASRISQNANNAPPRLMAIPKMARMTANHCDALDDDAATAPTAAPTSTWTGDPLPLGIVIADPVPSHVFVVVAVGTDDDDPAHSDE